MLSYHLSHIKRIFIKAHLYIKNLLLTLLCASNIKMLLFLALNPSSSYALHNFVWATRKYYMCTNNNHDFMCDAWWWCVVDTNLVYKYINVHFYGVKISACNELHLRDSVRMEIFCKICCIYFLNICNIVWPLTMRINCGWAFKMVDCGA